MIDLPGEEASREFVVGDMVRAAGGNYTQLSISGGVVAVHIEWICNLDWDFDKYCLPK